MVYQREANDRKPTEIQMINDNICGAVKKKGATSEPTFRLSAHMRLSSFIESNIEEISVEWERFAATLIPEENFSTLVLRDHVLEMLHEIARDMNRHQSPLQQQMKSEGDATTGFRIDEAADKHALERIKMGVSSGQLISEFRALRATIIRLWQRQPLSLDETSLLDLTRFNEAVDQLLSHAAVKHAEETERSRDMFLGILGHDLRNPLHAISALADLQTRAKTPERQVELAEKILVSAARMSHMITDLVELTRVRLGSGIAINPSRISMRRICLQAVEEMRAIYPHRIFEMRGDDDLMGEWDGPRLSQVFSNLLGNAVQHGAYASPITLAVRRDENGVEIEVHNEGNAIPQDIIPTLFDSLVRGSFSEKPNDDYSASLGLGLYIAKELVLAHGGTIDVRSSDDEGTSFVVHFSLPPDTTST